MILYSNDAFHVNILTPSCWHLPCRVLPSVLPLPIRTFTADYTDFYNFGRFLHCHLTGFLISLQLLELFHTVFKSHGRQLEWSLYGEANVICKKTGIVFSVSTVQMILLLAMNNSKAR